MKKEVIFPDKNCRVHGTSDSKKEGRVVWDSVGKDPHGSFITSFQSLPCHILR